MRADRLIATLLLLQSQTSITAAELARELEVSVRTARRDLDSLAMSGVPIYSRPGRGGGWSLIGGATTDLTGLSSGEANALFLAVGASSTASPALRSAVSKLAQALPETFRADAANASEAVVVDQTRWGSQPRQNEANPFFETLQESVVRRRQVVLGYAGPNKPQSVRAVHPLGLVVKAGVWYLVAGTESGQRTFRLTRIVSAELQDLPSKRPANFDLSEAWDAITVRVRDRKTIAIAEGSARTWTLPHLRFVFSTGLDVGDEVQPGWRSISVSSESAEAMLAQIAGFGSAVQITSPQSIRDGLATIGRELVDQYELGA